MVKIPFLLTSALLNTIVIVLFITAFFFTYISKTEKNLVETQVTSLVRNMNSELSIVLTEQEVQHLKELMSKLPVDTSQDASVEQSNQDIRQRTIRTLVIAGSVGLALVVLSTLIFRLNAGELAVSALTSVISVAIIEFVFAAFFVQNYKTLDENKVKLTIIKTLREYIRERDST